MSDIRLDGKVVVVTGAAGRLGQRVVDRFARQGATIAAVVRSEDEARSIPFPDGAEGWAFFPTDVTSEPNVEASFRQIGERFGRIFALVHAVGGWASQPFLETSGDDWERIVQMNLTSSFLCFREAARLMQGGTGRIIGIAARQGADQGRGGEAAYSAAKAGVVRLVEAVAAELEGSGITAHALAPSTILYGGEGDDARGVPAERLAELCLYLCSPAAEALNGATIRAYGSAVGA